MALVLADLVQETTSTTGTGTLTLTGAVTGFQTFAAIGNANTTYYRIKSGTDSEVGIGTYTLSGTTLSRDTVLYSSAGGTTKITVAAGATVICTYPAEKAVAFDDAGLLTIPDASALKWTSDLTLYRDSANTLAQRNATTSQVQRLYNTYTSPSDYARASLSFVTYSGALYTKLAAESAGTGAANIGIALSPKGTGAITAQVPDGTTAGGNARGANSVDLQTYRSSADRVVSGNYSFGAGYDNKLTGNYSVNTGYSNSCLTNYSFIHGYNNNTSAGQFQYLFGSYNSSSGTADYAYAFGSYNVVSASYAYAFGSYNASSASNTYAFGNGASANKIGQFAFGLPNSASVGGSQYSYLGFLATTTNATITEIFLGNAANTRATIPNSTTWAADIDIVARSTSGTENAYFKRRLVIQKGTTAASTALIGAVQTVGTDIGSANMLLIATPITLSADTTNGALKLEVTGIAATNIRWVAKVSLVEVGYA